MTTLAIWCREDEKRQVQLAAERRAMTMTAYVREALDRQLREDGLPSLWAVTQRRQRTPHDAR